MIVEENPLNVTKNPIRSCISTCTTTSNYCSIDIYTTLLRFLQINIIFLRSNKMAIHIYKFALRCQDLFKKLIVVRVSDTRNAY